MAEPKKPLTVVEEADEVKELYDALHTELERLDQCQQLLEHLFIRQDDDDDARRRLSDGGNYLVTACFKMHCGAAMDAAEKLETLLKIR